MLDLLLQEQSRLVLTHNPQLHRNTEAYMDDIVVKTKDKATLIQDLEETFANLRKINLKLNPEKCVWCSLRQATWILRAPSGD